MPSIFRYGPFRLRCRKYLAPGDIAYSMRSADRLTADGLIIEGTEIVVRGSITCQRRRWHRGEHQP